MAVAVRDIRFCDVVCTAPHDTVFDAVLNRFDVERVSASRAFDFDVIGNGIDLSLCEPLGFRHLNIRF